MKQPKTIARHVLIVGLLGIGLIACVFNLKSERPEVDPQGWWEGRGPVVPHENFPSDCLLCHQGNTWESIRDDFEFDHFAETGVALEGAHLEAECLRCHNDRGPVNVFSAQGCTGCHEDIHRNQLGNNCQDCHGVESWNPKGQIALHSQTRFPLIGAHAATACFACHEGAQTGEFTRTDIECATCHQADLALALNPDHVAQGWVADCDRCHIPTAWTGAAFNHSAFPLSGAHTSANCADCHVGGVFAGTPNDCADCHQGEYDATTSPNHASAGFSTSCQDCHGTSIWAGAGFTHSTFPLTGAHNAANCSDCHVGNLFAGTPSDCMDCHLPEFNATTNPNHASSGFPTSCQDCHSTTTWAGAGFTHDTFPLTGAHLAVTCTDCHLGGVFTGATSACASCHQADYDATNDPDHQAAGFPVSCESCHSTSDWEGAVFNHTSFALTGAHAAANCNDCHFSGTFGGLPSACIDCHQLDYNSTNNPPHQAAGFPVSCQTCHSTSTWNGATFNHSFPITTGAHKVLNCMDCHMVPSSFAIFSCIDCHEHSPKSKVDDDHPLSKVPGYTYNSPACYNCHPDGKND